MAVALFDTNILIDCLKGYQPAIDEVAYWDEVIISAITWMEVMAGTTGEERGAVREFLGNFEVIHTNQDIMDVCHDSAHRQHRNEERSLCRTPSSWRPA